MKGKRIDVSNAEILDALASIQFNSTRQNERPHTLRPAGPEKKTHTTLHASSVFFAFAALPSPEKNVQWQRNASDGPERESPKRTSLAWPGHTQQDRSAAGKHRNHSICLSAAPSSSLRGKTCSKVSTYVSRYTIIIASPRFSFLPRQGSPRRRFNGSLFNLFSAQNRT